MIPLEFTTFIGRLHPLFVHLPIGFILLAILLEWWEFMTKKESKSRLIPAAWFLGGMSAFAAALCGWLLGETGLYEEEHLFLHRWLGIALVPIAFLGWWIKRKREQFPRLIHPIFNVLLIILLSIEGHKGGNLTHGEDYLTEFAPKPIQRLLGATKDTLNALRTNNPDSVAIYADLIQPVFEAKCVSCHGNEIRRGALNMAHPDSLLLGGDGGSVITPGNPAESELFSRITLPQKNVKFMPPTPNLLTYDEIKTIEWWIRQGASMNGRVTDVELDESIKPVLLRRYGLNTEPRPWYEKVTIAPLENDQIRAIEQQGFRVSTLGGENPLVDISYSGQDLTAEKMGALEPAKKHITWLSLSGTNIENDWLAVVSGFNNLTRLELDKTGISDDAIAYLKHLPHLEALNLYATQVTNSALPMFQMLPELRRVYLSETKIDPEKANEFFADESKLSVIIDSRAR